VTTTQQILDQLAELRRELFMLVGRVSRLEERIELAIEAPPIEKRVVPPSVVGAAAKLGEELTEGRRIVREAKTSAGSLSRAISPISESQHSRSEDDTAKIGRQKKDV
jgi:hypothetical protein